MLYGVLYGAERMIVEGMRTDSLYIGSTTIRVSQLLSAIIVVVALAFFVYFMTVCKKGKLPKALQLDDLDALEEANKKQRQNKRLNLKRRKDKRLSKSRKRKIRGIKMNIIDGKAVSKK